MQTTSIWLAPDPRVLAAISPTRDDLLDGLRALTYLLHHLAPIFLLSDVRDVGSWLGDGAPARTRHGERRSAGRSARDGGADTSARAGHRASRRGSARSRRARAGRGPARCWWSASTAGAARPRPSPRSRVCPS